MRYYIIAGEASGDLHGGNLIKELKRLDDKAEIRGWGGDLMQAAGAALVKHYRDLAFMGFTEVVMNLKTILANLKFCKEDIQQFKPDVLVLIDYPGFNLRIAEWMMKMRNEKSGMSNGQSVLSESDFEARSSFTKIIFYISPQVWAWKESRVPKMKKYIDKMLVILPFEKDYYKNKWNWDVEYTGHPLVQVIESFKASSIVNPRLNDPVGQGETSIGDSNSNIIALLPGSRKQEISKKLPIMLEVSRSFPQYQFVVAKAAALDDEFYAGFMHSYTNVSSVKNKTYELLTQAKAALVTSGTATLETALFGVPEVVCYKGGNISYQIAKRLIKIKYIALVNLIMDKPVVKELIQNELTAENLTHELSDLLNNPKRQQQLQDDYRDLRNILSAGGDASANAAKIIFNFASA